MFTKEQYVDWMQSSVTRELVQILKTNRYEFQESMSEGKTGSGAETDRQIGRCMGLKDAVLVITEGLKELIVTGEEDNGNRPE